MTRRFAGTVRALCEAINRCDLDAAVNFYEQDAKILSESGEIMKGQRSIRIVFENFIRIKPNIVIFSERLVGEGDFIVSFSQWELSGLSRNGDRINVKGNSADVLRKQSNGTWRITIHSPWGASVAV